MMVCILWEKNELKLPGGIRSFTWLKLSFIHSFIHASINFSFTHFFSQQIQQQQQQKHLLFSVLI